MSRGSIRAVRVLCHAQHFKGIGHFVRMHAIARGMSEAHEVYLVDGGRPVPRRPGPIELIPLPRLVRVEGRVVGLETATPVASLVEQRIRLLTQAVERIRPDAVLVDIYPFSKWEVEEEITRMIAVARRLNAGVRVVTSLRDIVPMSRSQVAPPGGYEAGVLSRLASFDAILTHGDPSFARIEDYFDRAADVPLPVHYTGFVTGLPAPPVETPEPGTYAVLSCGGDTASLAFLLSSIEAFRRLRARGALGAMSLRVFPSPDVTAADVAALSAATCDGPFRLCEFSPDFDAWLAGSALSISRCGYNTTVQLLQARVRSVQAPIPSISDQPPRARRLAKLGLATVIDGAAPSVEAIATAIEEAMAQPPVEHALDLDGVAATRRILEELVAGAGPSSLR
jgi:predicted glycosyltransferase